MRSNQLSAVTSHMIATYGKTASHAVHAYHAGGQRVVRSLEARWNQSLSASRTRLASGVARNATALQQRLQQVAESGLAMTSDGAHSLIKNVVHLADAGVQSVADNALWLENRLGTQALSKLSQVAVPAATTLDTLAVRLERRCASLAKRIAGRKPVVASARRVRSQKA